MKLKMKREEIPQKWTSNSMTKSNRWSITRTIFFLAYIGNLVSTSSEFGKQCSIFHVSYIMNMTNQLILFSMLNNFINNLCGMLVTFWVLSRNQIRWSPYGLEKSFCLSICLSDIACTQAANSCLLTYIFLADQGAKLICGIAKNVSSSIYFYLCSLKIKLFP